MTPAHIKALVNGGAALAAFVAAGLWWYASIAIVRPSNSVGRDGWSSAQITVEHESTGQFDPFLTNVKQANINKWAAIAAGFAAMLQGASLVLPDA